MTLPSAYALEIPGATLAALMVAAALRWAYRGGNIRWLPMGAIGTALAVFVVWRIVRLQDGVLTVLDVFAGVLCGLLLWAALRAAWRDGPWDRPDKGHANTPLGVLMITGAVAAVALLLSFQCLGVDCPANAPIGGVHVNALPAGDWR